MLVKPNSKDYLVTVRVVTEYKLTVEATNADDAVCEAFDNWQDAGTVQWSDVDVIDVIEDF